MRFSRFIPPALIAAAFASLAVAQTPMPAPPNPNIPADAKMQVNLYPITRFRGTATALTKSDEKISAMEVESIFHVRGVWDLCSEIPIAIVVRSVKLVGDTGPSFVQPPVARAGPDIPIEHETRLAQSPSTPSPVVAPKVEEGGRRGDNPALAGAPAQSGRETKFFAAPAQNGLRVLACAQQPGSSPGPRCVQSAADGYCVAEGYKESVYREFEMIAGQAYLSNVLCTKGGDEAEDRGGFRLPGFGR